MKTLFHIFSDGSCDLPMDIVREKDISVVPFYVSFDNKTYLKEMEELKVRDFYQKMVEEPKVFPKSSLPSTQDYIDAFLPIVQQTIPILCICITTKFSVSMQSAIAAAEMIKEDYPNAVIEIIDATVNTV